jgi:hypothetical protein
VKEYAGMAQPYHEAFRLRFALYAKQANIEAP